MKEVTEEDVLKEMRHDSKKLDDAMDELEELTADLRKASELITNAVIRYRKEKLKKKSLKTATEDGAFSEIEGYTSREEIRNAYGWDMISESEMDRLFYLWDLREQQKQKQKNEVYEDNVTQMLFYGIRAIEDKHEARKEELEEICDNAKREARRRAQVINESRNGFLMI